jgi:O-antigen/teichoic acid export membrane protein
VAAGTVALVAPVGRAGWVTAIMVASMPLVALQFPARILLERSMLYRRLSLVEMVQVLCYHGWNVVTVLAGFGVWGLATGAIVRAAVATVVLAVVVPAGNVRPVFDRAAIRPLIGFGLQFQAVNATVLARDQTFNLALGAVAGVAPLGQWSLTRRIMEVPWLLFYSLSRVALPAVPQLLATGREPKELVERAVALTAVGSGFLLTGLAGGAPGLVPGVFGEHWAEVSGAVAFSCLGVGLTGSVATVKNYLYAVDDAAAVLKAGLVQALLWFVVGLPLLPLVGVAAVGVAWSVAAAVEAVLLSRAARRHAPMSLVPPLAAQLAVGVVAAGAGWMLSVELGGYLWSGLVGGALSVAVFAVGLLVFRRAVLLDAVRLGARSVAVVVRRTVRRSEGTGGW